MMLLLEERKENSMESLQLEIMNTSFYIGISDHKLTQWKQPIISFLQYVNQEFSRFRKDNELWRFNEIKKGSTIVVSPILYDMLKKAEGYRVKTEGRFSPYLLNQLNAHGYDQSFPFEASDIEGTPITIHVEKELQPLIFEDGCKITKNTEQKIDLGGIAKGYAVEAVSKWLQENTDSTYGMVDGGGDMSLWSNGEKNWTIGIMDPYQEDKKIASFTIQNGGIATSNIIYRSWVQGNIQKHHILDGRTGMPVSPDISQATIVTNHCLDAEVSAKLCFMDDSHDSKCVR